MEFAHKSVLLDETIEGLKIKPDGFTWTARLAAADTAAKSAEGFQEGA